MTTALEQQLAQALENVKLCVVGDRHPNWSSAPAVYAMRSVIADHCDEALAAFRARQQAEQQSSIP